jgi:hypothetical protein
VCDFRDARDADARDAGARGSLSDEIRRSGLSTRTQSEERERCERDDDDDDEARETRGEGTARTNEGRAMMRTGRKP